ncbi:hypothetical protein LP420_03100 [Massilia sp. B-10]|nr:hypothetical protein LP420_03100 [Massilia sp. B-10]
MLTDGLVYPSEHPRIMRMKESALHAGVLETYITFLMMACDTNDRGMIESMVKAIVTEYTPHTPALANASTPRSPTRLRRPESSPSASRPQTERSPPCATNLPAAT